MDPTPEQTRKMVYKIRAAVKDILGENRQKHDQGERQQRHQNARTISASMAPWLRMK